MIEGSSYYSMGAVFSGMPTYGALTQKFLITAGANGSSWAYPYLWNDTLGTGTTVDLGQYDYYNPPPSIPVNPIGSGSFAYAVAEGLESHTFALVVPAYNWSFPVSKLPVLGCSGVDGSGNPAFVSLGFFNAFSITQMSWLNANDAVLVDLTAQTQSAPNATDLRDPASWVPKTVSVPTREVTFDFGPVDWQYSPPQGAHYFLQSSSGAAQSLVPMKNWVDTVSHLTVTGQVGVGDNYWLSTPTGTVSTPIFQMDGGNTTVWKSAAPIPVPTTNFQSMIFRIGENHLNQQLFVVQQGEFGPNFIPLSYSPGSGALVTWNEAGNTVNYPFVNYEVMVDMNLPWTLMNYSLGTDYGAVTQLFDGFVPYNPVPPGYVPMSIPEARRSSLTSGNLKLHVDDGTEWLVSPIDGFELPDYYLTFWMLTNVGTPLERSTEFHYIPSMAPTTSMDPAQLTLHDAGEDDEIAFSAGGLGNNFGLWLPEVPLNLNLPESRWTQELHVITAAGGMFPVVKGSIQGVWSNDGTSTVFTSYHFFDATSKMHRGTDWWVYAPYGNWGQPAYSDKNGLDIGGNPSLLNWTPESDMTDSDNDGLPNGWEGRWFGNLSSTGTQNPDGDDWDNATELANGTNPIDAAPVITLTSPAGAMLVN